MLNMQREQKFVDYINNVVSVFSSLYVYYIFSLSVSHSITLPSSLALSFSVSLYLCLFVLSRAVKLQIKHSELNTNVGASKDSIRALELL